MHFCDVLKKLKGEVSPAKCVYIKKNTIISAILMKISQQIEVESTDSTHIRMERMRYKRYIGINEITNKSTRSENPFSVKKYRKK